MSRGVVNDERRSPWQVFRWPLLIAVASAAGLVAGLVADGVWDAVSWVLLGVPLVTAVACMRRG